MNLTEDEVNAFTRYLDMSMKETTNITLEEQRIKDLMKDKHEELVQYLKEKYPEEFI